MGNYITINMHSNTGDSAQINLTLIKLYFMSPFQSFNNRFELIHRALPYAVLFNAFSVLLIVILPWKQERNKY